MHFICHLHMSTFVTKKVVQSSQGRIFQPPLGSKLMLHIVEELEAVLFVFFTFQKNINIVVFFVSQTTVVEQELTQLVRID